MVVMTGMYNKQVIGTVARNLTGDIMEILKTLRDVLPGMFLLSFLLATDAVAELNDGRDKAGIYKGQDDEGATIYSDKQYYDAEPFEDAEKIDPAPINVVDPVVVTPEEKSVEQDKTTEFRYVSFSILSPTNEQFIWNEPDLAVRVQLKPELNAAEGHIIWLLMDGKPLVKNSRSPVMQIGRADRGEHKIQALIKDRQGKIIKRTPPVTIHIKNTVISR